MSSSASEIKSCHSHQLYAREHAGKYEQACKQSNNHGETQHMLDPNKTDLTEQNSVVKNSTKPTKQQRQLVCEFKTTVDLHCLNKKITPAHFSNKTTV